MAAAGPALEPAPLEEPGQLRERPPVRNDLPARRPEVVVDERLAPIRQASYEGILGDEEAGVADELDMRCVAVGDDCQEWRDDEAEDGEPERHDIRRSRWWVGNRRRRVGRGRIAPLLLLLLLRLAPMHHRAQRGTGAGENQSAQTEHCEGIIRLKP